MIAYKSAGKTNRLDKTRNNPSESAISSFFYC